MPAENIPGMVCHGDSGDLYLEDISEEEGCSFFQEETFYSFSTEVNRRIRQIFFWASSSYERGNSFSIEQALARINDNTFSSETEALNDLIDLYNFIVKSLFSKNPRQTLRIGEELLKIIQETFPEAIDAIEKLRSVQQAMALKALALRFGVRDEAHHHSTRTPKIAKTAPIRRAVTASKADSQRCIIM